MATPIDTARDVLDRYQTPQIRNLFAQSSASYVLYEVGEDEGNFPQFDAALTDKVTMSAYALLAAGVSLAESEPSAESIAAMEEAATLLNNVHLPHARQASISSFHVLISSMAFYAAGQYSRAFVAMRRVEAQTDLARMIALFVRKRPGELIQELNAYILADLEELTDPWELCDHAVTTAIARALSYMLEYLASGESRFLEAADELVNTAMDLADDYNSPSHWWISRLLRLMIRGHGSASPWQVLPPHFPDGQDLLSRYIRLLLFRSPPVTELWRSQRDAIPTALDRTRGGAVINMRTSSGKTRVAEMAILQTLDADPNAKVLYLAPFRSLALEIEQSLGQVFDWCGFRVSHLYGGYRISAIDRELAEDSSITIATPEKARAILRSSPELLAGVKLIVVDEGHLVGANERYVKNELFIDHLRQFAATTECRVIMLSAVLPNPAHLAEWVTGSRDNTVRSEWKPSAERFGLLRWQGNNVRIDWHGEFESFNPRFVQSQPLGWGRRRNPFPNTKNEAIAATAVRLMSVGPVMIFSARANSIPGLAKAVLLAMGEAPRQHPWPEAAWNVFQATCQEELPAGAIELNAARCGIICHSNRLSTQVRMATERLMRSTAPKVIIASSTLAQGVNVGVSSVIVATPYQGRHPIDHRDFWNICGRAGRAFVDGEGKILYAIDETKQGWQVRRDYRLANEYFDARKGDPVVSGLLHVLRIMRRVAVEADVEFAGLLTMVAENDFSAFTQDTAQLCSYILDLIDDGLLAMQEDGAINPSGEGPETWVDDVFRGSLAAIQADSEPQSVSRDELMQLLKTRARNILDNTPEPEQRKAIVSTGLPISAARNVYRDRDEFCRQAQLVADADQSWEAMAAFVAWLELWAREHANQVVEALPGEDAMQVVRELWLLGKPMRVICENISGADQICKEVYGYQIPWLIHAASQQLRQMGNEDLSKRIASVALFVELGVPNEVAAWVFLAGVRSRAAATEMASCGAHLGASFGAIRRSLQDSEVVEELKRRVSDNTKVWLDLHWSALARSEREIPTITRFRFEALADVDRIVVRRLGKRTFLCSVDGVRRCPVKVSEKWPFDRIADDYRFCFDRVGDEFVIRTRDPRTEADLMS